MNSDNVSFESGTKDGILTETCSSVVSYRITLAKRSYQIEIALPSFAEDFVKGNRT